MGENLQTVLLLSMSLAIAGIAYSIGRTQRFREGHDTAKKYYLNHSTTYSLIETNRLNDRISP